jgi:hypothetical protein
MNLYSFKIKNDQDGQTFLRVLRKVVKQKGGGRVKVRGRGHRHGVRRYRQDLPIRLATSLAIYIQ